LAEDKAVMIALIHCPVEILISMERSLVLFFHLKRSESLKIEWNRISKKYVAEMYGNYYDYGDPDLTGLKTRTDEILTDIRSSVSGLSNTGVSDVFTTLAGGRAGRLSDAGVGDISSFLEDAYTPYVPTSTSYSDFMADTPSRIASTIGAYQSAYAAGQEDRMKDFQDLLSEVRSYTYGEKTPDGYTPGSLNESTIPAPQPAMAEIKALMPKFKTGSDKKTENSLQKYKDLFGNKFSKSDYNSLIDQGVSEDRIQENLMAYNQAGGNVGDSVFGLMGYETVDPDEIGKDKMGPFQTTQRGDYIIPKGKAAFDFASYGNLLK
jgi:hypothetical protein